MQYLIPMMRMVGSWLISGSPVVFHLVQQQHIDDGDDPTLVRQPARIALPVLEFKFKLKLQRPSCLASVLHLVWPYVEIDTILMLPTLLVCQQVCLMVIVNAILVAVSI